VIVADLTFIRLAMLVEAATMIGIMVSNIWAAVAACVTMGAVGGPCPFKADITAGTAFVFILRSY